MNDPLNRMDPSGLDPNSDCFSSYFNVKGTYVVVLTCRSYAGTVTIPISFLPSFQTGQAGAGGPFISATPPIASPKNGKMAACGNGAGSVGFGIGGGYNLDLGLGFAGASSTGGVGAGAFHNSGGGATSGYSAGAFASGGATAYAGSHIAGAPQQSSSTAFSLGAYAGVGANVFVSNAASVRQLSGPFTTVSINVGLGPANVGFQGSFGGGIWQVSVTPPFASIGYGAAGSVVTTNTVATQTGCNGG